MEISPLTQQNRSASFQPKIDRLYDDLFKQDDETSIDSEGFWEEFFLLRPDINGLENRLKALRADDLLHLQDETQQLFLRAIDQVKGGRSQAVENALDVSSIGSVSETYFDTY